MKISRSKNDSLLAVFFYRQFMLKKWIVVNLLFLLWAWPSNGKCQGNPSSEFDLVLECFTPNIIYLGDITTRELVKATIINTQNIPLEAASIQFDILRNNVLLYSVKTENQINIPHDQLNLSINNLDLFGRNSRFNLIEKNRTPLFNQLLSSAGKTGVIPEGEYAIQAKLKDVQNVVLAEDFCTIMLSSESVFDLELLSPGEIHSFDPAEISTPLPFFQWISKGEKFNFFLYEVQPGRSIEETVQARPIFYIKNYPGTTLLYPLAAQMLEPGKTYAWLVQLVGEGLSGDEVVKESEIYTFRVAEAVQPVAEFWGFLPPAISGNIQAATQGCSGETIVTLNGRRIELEELYEIFRRIQAEDLVVRRVIR